MPVTVHFLNVGHGDCTVIEHASGNITVVDVNNCQDLDPETAKELEEAYSANSVDIRIGKLLGKSENEVLKTAGYDVELANPIDFLKTNYPSKSIFRYVQTHPDLDHMRGLAMLATEIGMTNFWDTSNEKELTDFLSDADRDDWATYQAIRAGNKQITVLKLTRGATGIYYNQNPQGVAGGDGIKILAPTPELAQAANDSETPNLHSYVLAIEHAGRRIILGGDADVDVWESIVAQYSANQLSCVVLKASHHGRESGYSEEAMNLMKPWCVVLSVGKKPETDAHNLYKKHCDNVWSTRWLGNMKFVIHDDGAVKYSLQYGDRL